MKAQEARTKSFNWQAVQPLQDDAISPTFCSANKRPRSKLRGIWLPKNAASCGEWTSRDSISFPQPVIIRHFAFQKAHRHSRLLRHVRRSQQIQISPLARTVMEFMHLDPALVQQRLHAVMGFAHAEVQGLRQLPLNQRVVAHLGEVQQRPGGERLEADGQHQGGEDPPRRGKTGNSRVRRSPDRHRPPPARGWFRPPPGWPARP